MAVALALMTALAWGTVELWMLRAAKRMPVVTLTRWLMLIGTVVIVPIALVSGPPPGLDDLPYAIVPALFALGGTFAYFTALRAGQLSIVSPTVATSGGIGAVIAIAALGERFAPAVIVGLAIGVAGVVLATFVRGVGRADGVGWALFAALLLAIYTVALASSSARVGPVWSVAAYRLTSLLVLWPTAPFSRHPIRIDSTSMGLVVRAAVVETIGFLAFTTALELGPVAVVAVVAAQFSTVAVALAAFVLHERLRRHQWVGVAMMIGSTTVLGTMR